MFVFTSSAASGRECCRLAIEAGDDPIQMALEKGMWEVDYDDPWLKGYLEELRERLALSKECVIVFNRDMKPQYYRTRRAR